MRYAGKTVVVVASGPSLTEEDCCAVAHLPVLAVNNSWRMAPGADIVYAGDYAWWRENGYELAGTKAQRWTCSRRAADVFGLHHHAVAGGYNSGMRAIELAISLGADSVLLLGFDCSLENGVHWHGAHEKTKNPTGGVVSHWHNQFATMYQGKAEVINCSRYSDLKRFPRMDLADALRMNNVEA